MSGDQEPWVIRGGLTAELQVCAFKVVLSLRFTYQFVRIHLDDIFCQFVLTETNSSRSRYGSLFV